MVVQTPRNTASSRTALPYVTDHALLLPFFSLLDSLSLSLLDSLFLSVSLSPQPCFCLSLLDSVSRSVLDSLFLCLSLSSTLCYSSRLVTDRPKQLNLHLLNSGTKDVPITVSRSLPAPVGEAAMTRLGAFRKVTLVFSSSECQEHTVKRSSLDRL